MNKYLYPCLLCLMMVSSVAGDVIHVPGDVSTIQAGINAAQTDDTILVGPNVYSGVGNRDIDFLGKRIVVMSSSGAASTTILCQGSSTEPHFGFIFQNGEDTLSILKGFTIIGGFAPIIFPEGSAGGGIFCYGGSPKIDSCIIKQSTASHGGGLMSYQSAPLVTNCEFIENIAYNNGGGVMFYESSAVIRDCLFADNDVYDVDAGGGGFGGFYCDSIIMKRCYFEGNTSLEDGGGAFFHSTPKVKVDSCVFLVNETQYEGGAVYVENTTSEFSNCIFYDNYAASACGGMLCELSEMTFENCSFVMNESPNSAAIVFTDPTGPVNMSKTIIAFNNSYSMGTDNLSITYNFDCCDIYGNTKGDWTGFWSGFAATNGNMSADPLFCAYTSDLSVRDNSPCLPVNNDCNELIGMQGQGCTCCVGMTGNANCSEDEAPDISDIIRIIDYLYINRTPLCCPAEANTDGVGVYPISDPDVSDIIKIIDNLYLSHAPLSDCPE